MSAAGGVLAVPVLPRDVRPTSVNTDVGGEDGWWVRLGDAGLLLAIALVIPLVILGVGIPVALVVRGLLWIAGLL